MPFRVDSALFPIKTLNLLMHIPIYTPSLFKEEQITSRRSRDSTCLGEKKDTQEKELQDLGAVREGTECQEAVRNTTARRDLI